MTRPFRALTVLRGTIAIVVLAAATALSAAGAAAATPTTSPDDPAAAPANPAQTVLANQARLLESLGDVLARLQANPNVNEHAKAALVDVVARVQSGEHGLLNAASRIANGDASGDEVGVDPSLPAQAANHPTASDHPTASGHPTASDHPSASDDASGPDLPPLPDHPTASDHPSASDHPTAGNHPGRP